MDAELRSAIALIPLIQSLTYGEASVAVTDRNVYVADVPSRQLNFGVKPGDPVKEGGGAQASMASGELISREQPASVFGVPYLVHAAPIRDANQAIIGAIVVRLPLHLEQELSKMAVGLASAMTQFSGTFQEIAAVAEHTAQASNRLATTADTMNTALTESESVTRAITKVSDRIQLLGLNALIEAAHAGAAGAGFGVVAREIQSLAQRTLKATEDTARSLQAVSAQNNAVVAETQALQADSETLHAQVEQCVAMVESLTTMAQKLKDLAARADGARG